MMKTVSFEIGKRMEELECIQEHYFCYNEWSGHLYAYKSGNYPKYPIPAYTADEVIDMLPDGYAVWKHNGKYYCDEIDIGEYDYDAHITESFNIADAPSKMWIHLRELGLI